MSNLKGGAYRADNRVTINNIAELNLIIDALQDKAALLVGAAREMDRRGTPMSRMMHLKHAATTKLLDRLRVGWKAADGVPAEIQEMLARNEDKRFWTNVERRVEELQLEISLDVETVDESALITVYPF